MVRRSKNEGGGANCNAIACPAKVPVKPPYKLTAREKGPLAKFEAASETRGPRLKVQADGATAKFSVNHPDEAVGILALMRAIGTTDLDFYDGLMGHLVNASRQQNALSQSGTNFMLSVVKGIEPRDQMEAMLATEGFVHALMIRANAAKLDTGDVAALVALDLIAGLAVFGRAPLEVVIDTLAKAARTREILVRDALNRNERPPPLNTGRLSPLAIEFLSP